MNIQEHTLVNLIDLSNLSKWSEQWLDKLNPDKTDIMVFSIRNRDFNSNFNFNNIQIDPLPHIDTWVYILVRIVSGLFILIKLLKSVKTIKCS